VRAGGPGAKKAAKAGAQPDKGGFK
jgi:hypothetical protein